MKPIRLVSGFLTVGLWTLLSRVLGFARDIMIAAYLGTGPVAEAFLIAFSLPNVFRRFFAEGAFNMAFVPMFSKKVEGDEDAAKFANDAFTGLASVPDRLYRGCDGRDAVARARYGLWISRGRAV
jgi:putative peptidoglycan lipid II flippase